MPGAGDGEGCQCLTGQESEMESLGYVAVVGTQRRESIESHWTLGHVKSEPGDFVSLTTVFKGWRRQQARQALAVWRLGHSGAGCRDGCRGG